MTMGTIEQQKQLYSRQLAAHTFRQWELARSEKEMSAATGIRNQPVAGPGQGHENVENNRSRGMFSPAFVIHIHAMVGTGVGIRVRDFAADLSRRQKGSNGQTKRLQ